MSDSPMVAEVQTLTDDPYERDTLIDPYPFFDRLRRTPAAYLEKYGVHAFGRDREVRQILEDWETFVSGAGVGPVDFDEDPPTWWRPGILEVDPPIHTRMRAAMTGVINPRKLRPLRAGFQAYAVELLDEMLVPGLPLDAAELAKRYTLRVFGDAVGIPREGRDPNLVLQGAMNFSRFGPLNDIAQGHMEAADGVMDWVMNACARENLDAGGMGAQIWEYADSGDVPPEEATLLVRAMLSAGLDTTIFALINTLAALSQVPEQYAQVHANPRLVKFAVDEAFRYDTPFQSFFRKTSREVEISGVPLPAGVKILVFPGSANRDEEKWGAGADRYDVDRDSSGHLTFGMGIHQCVGQPISRMEIDALLTEFVSRVQALAPAAPAEPFVHTTLKSYTRVPLDITLA